MNTQTKKPRGAQSGNKNAAKQEQKNSVIWVSCTPEQKAMLVKAANGKKLVDFVLQASLEKAVALYKHIRYDGCDVTLYANPELAVKNAKELRGIQKYVTDKGEELWTCEGRVTDCEDKDACLDVESWWDEDWTTHIDDYYVIDSRTGFYQ